MNKLSLFIGFISAVFLLWFALSWFDVITDNLTKNPKHSKYNAFVVLVDIMEDKKQ